MKKFNLIFLVLFSGCSSLNKTLLYSSIGGSITGALMGRELSPDRESDNFNTLIGAGIGAAVVTGAAYWIYRESRPELKLENTPLKDDLPLKPIEDSTLNLGSLGIAPPFEPITEKKFIKLPNDLPEEVRKTAKKPYFRKHKTKEVIFEEDGKTFKIPPFEVIESGVEQ